MDQALLHRVVEELQATLTGRFLGKTFQLTPLSFAVDFGLRGEFLYLSADPASPRLYLIQRRTKELDKQSIAPHSFGQAVRSKLGGGYVVQVAQDPLDRVVRVTLRFGDEVGGIHFRRLVIQLTGRTANLFLLDELNRISAALREQPQAPAEIYQPPPRPVKEPAALKLSPTGSPSGQLDAYFASLDAAKAFATRAKEIRARLTKKIRQQQTLRDHLHEDLARHGDPDTHKKIGDLLLANLATAIRTGNVARITDYYAAGAPLVEVEVDEKRTLQEEAAARFRQYTKAKRAAAEIAGRLQKLERESADLERRLHELDQLILAEDAAALESFEKPAPAPKFLGKKSTKPQKIAGVRRYLSTDGYEILVGRAARDNDNLTFSVAQPSDLWMHAGDYPGSHVVVRNPTRKEIPHRTIIEAAQLAGRFSQASADTKVVVHYVERKFLSKPKGAAPGLVRMSRFRSITVEPKEAIQRL